MIDQEQREAVLAWLNEMRVKYGVGEPLTEIPPDATSGGYISENCPVAKALGRGCGFNYVDFNEESRRIPSYVREFMMDHDRRVSVLPFQ